jgi:hypothetical protein
VYAPDVDLALLEIMGDAAEQAAFFDQPDEEGGEEVAESASVNGEEEKGDADLDERQQEAAETRPKKKPKEESKLALEFANELPVLRESVHVVGYVRSSFIPATTASFYTPCVYVPCVLELAS